MVSCRHCIVIDFQWICERDGGSHFVDLYIVEIEIAIDPHSTIKLTQPSAMFTHYGEQKSPVILIVEGMMTVHRRKIRGRGKQGLVRRSKLTCTHDCILTQLCAMTLIVFFGC
jgi:hypothetical protein